MDIECGGFTFVSNFDSSNIDRVELVPQAENGNFSRIFFILFSVLTFPRFSGYSSPKRCPSKSQTLPQSSAHIASFTYMLQIINQEMKKKSRY